MKNFKALYVILLLVLISSCATLNKTAILNSNKVQLDELTLEPDFDLYNLRINLIRQKTMEQEDDSTEHEIDVSYHCLGFNLGNGLFYDLNNNLSIKLTELFQIKTNGEFKIIRETPAFIFKKRVTYTRKGQTFKENGTGLFSISNSKKIEFSDSLVKVRENFLSSYKIIKQENSLTYRSLLNKDVIHQSDEGYYTKNLLWKTKYKLVDNEVQLNEGYILRHQGKKIDLFKKGILGVKLKYSLVKSENEIFFYDSDFKGIRISLRNNKIEVEKNNDIIGTYYLKK